MEIKEVKMIDESEFSDLVEKTYGKPYKFQQCGPSGSSEYGGFLDNDSIFAFSVPYDWEIESEEQERWNKWVNSPYDPPLDRMEKFKYNLDLERDESAPLSLLIEDMASKGLIEPGNYYLHIWW